MKIKNGITRKVFLIGNYAIKVPQTAYQFRHFLQGLLGNMQEKQMWALKDDRMCPTIFSMPGGWVNIMPKCKPLTEDEFFKLDFSEFKSGDFSVPVENKICSFGWYKNRIVAIDYGS